MEYTEQVNFQGKRAVNPGLNNICNGFKKDMNVQVIGVGTFVVRNRNTRKAGNPQTTGAGQDYKINKGSGLIALANLI